MSEQSFKDAVRSRLVAIEGELMRRNTLEGEEEPWDCVSNETALSDNDLELEYLTLDVLLL
jgi:hypothetical protein